MARVPTTNRMGVEEVAKQSAKKKAPPTLAEIAKIKRERKLRRSVAKKLRKEQKKNGAAPVKPPPEVKPLVTPADIKAQADMYTKQTTQRLKDAAALKAKHAM